MAEIYALDGDDVGKLKAFMGRRSLAADQDFTYPTTGSDIQWISINYNYFGNYLAEQQEYTFGADGFHKSNLWALGQVVQPDGRDTKVTSANAHDQAVKWTWNNTGDDLLSDNGDPSTRVYGNFVWVRSPLGVKLHSSGIYPCIRIGRPVGFVERAGYPSRDFFMVLDSQKPSAYARFSGWANPSTNFGVFWDPRVNLLPEYQLDRVSRLSDYVIGFKHIISDNKILTDDSLMAEHPLCQGGFYNKGPDMWGFMAAIRFSFGGHLVNSAIRYGANVYANADGTNYAQRFGQPLVEAFLPAIIVDGVNPDMNYTGNQVLTAVGSFPSGSQFFINCFGNGASGGLSGAGGLNIATTPSPGILRLPEHSFSTTNITPSVTPPSSTLPNMAVTVEATFWKIADWQRIA